MSLIKKVNNKNNFKISRNLMSNLKGKFIINENNNVKGEIIDINQKPLSKNNILLVEFNDPGNTNDGEIKEIFSDNNNKICMISGYRIFSVHDANGNELTHYNAILDKTDLDCFKDKKGFYLVAVTKNKYNSFLWKCWILGDEMKSASLFHIHNGRECTEAECNILDEVFPEYFKHAF